MAATAKAPQQKLFEQFSYSIPDVCQLVDLSRQTIYDEINAGRLRTFTVGRRRFVSAKALQDWIEAREAATNTSSPDAA